MQSKKRSDIMVGVKKFQMNLKKDKYYDDIEDIKASIEKNVDRQVKNYFDENPNFHIIDVTTCWFDEEDNYVFSAHVTYKVTPIVIDECLCL